MFGNKDSKLLDAVIEGDLESVKAACRKGCDVNAKNFLSVPAITLAISMGRKDVVLFLLEQDDIDVNLTSVNDVTPLMTACKEGHTEIVQALLQHKDIEINRQSLHGNTALIHAAGMGHEEIVDILLQYEDIELDGTYTVNKESPYTIALKNGFPGIAEKLKAFESSRFPRQRPMPPGPV